MTVSPLPVFMQPTSKAKPKPEEHPEPVSQQQAALRHKKNEDFLFAVIVAVFLRQHIKSKFPGLGGHTCAYVCIASRRK